MSKKVVVIEDDLRIQDSLRLALETEGYQVFSAANGKEGIELVGSISDTCVILLDLMMPIMDGFEFLAARKLDASLSKVPVILVSAFPDRAIGVEAQGFVKKPVNLNDLFHQVKAYCC